MPIKLPKSFSRRKSSGTALEEVVNPPEPSFRVFERPPGGSKSFDGGIALKRMSQGRPLSSPSSRVDENLFDDERDDTDPSRRLVGDGESGWRTRLTYGRGSGGTHHSSSTGGLYDTSSSSARFSSTSTLPSSTDATPDEPHPASSKILPELPPPPIPDSQPAFSVRAAGRAFSFGRKASQPTKSGNTHVETSGSKATTRERAMTESSFASASTATPPKLLDADLNLGGSDLDGFGNMFESFGKRTSTVLDDNSILRMDNTASPEAIAPSPPAVPPKSYSGDKSRYTPSPIHIDRTQIIDSSPCSWGSHDSRDGLMSSLTPPAAFQSFDPNNSPPVPRHGNLHALTPSRVKPVHDTGSPTANPSSERSSPVVRSGLQKGSAYVLHRASNSLEDRDAKLLNSVHPSRVSTRPRGHADKFKDNEDKGEQELLSASSSRRLLDTPPSPENSRSRQTDQPGTANGLLYTPAALFDSEDPEVAGVSSTWRGESTETTPRARKLEPVRHEEPPLFDDSLLSSASLAAQYEHKLSLSPKKPVQRHKVMTPAQFERYRREQEMTRSKSNASRSEASEDGSDVDDDDDDETERNRQAARQRRRQEAHLAVYRQQMMKVTGEQPADLPMLAQSRPDLDRSGNGTPVMSSRMSTANLGVGKSTASGRSSDDEDEDVPLGILAAHGFPSKNRPPTQLSTSHPKANLRASIQSIPPPPGSVMGESTTSGARHSLPVFARNLPPDPYYGAGLVNPSNREFLNNGGGSVYGGPQPSLPPGGLVGVIAGEERARAMRRGSPNTQGVYGPPGAQEAVMPHMHPGMQRTMNMGNMGGMGQGAMPGMHPVPMMSPGDQAQFQMTQQMAQMMQMQMQWMQQMMHSQGLQPNSHPLPPPPSQVAPQQLMHNGLLGPPGHTQRPMSMGSNTVPSMNGGPQINHRAMSMLDPGTARWGQQNNQKSTFLPSMGGAPGGQGYAPSIAPTERSNVGMPTRYRPVSIAPEAEAKNLSSRTSTFTSGTLQGWAETQGGPPGGKAQNSRKGAGLDSDEDEDEGWEDMMKKREKKKLMWRLRKSTDGFQDMLYPGT